MEPPALEGVEHRFHDLPTGVRVHVAHAGPEDAPALVALHGFPQHWYAWRRVIPLLPGLRLLAMDLRGLGWSGPPAELDFRKARLAEDAVALLDVLGIERAMLLGHDWGGWAGFIAALDTPERWTGLVAAGIAHPWQPPATALRALPRLAYQPPLAVPVLGPRIVRTVVSRLLRTAWGDRATYDDAAEEIYAARYREPEHADAASRLYRDFLTRELARNDSVAGRRLQIPTRLLQGTRDPLGTALALGLERHGDDASTILLEGCGHFVPEERPAAIAAAVREINHSAP
jgi:pimeloyl-ACP methyl ester carboxylesterase